MALIERHPGHLGPAAGQQVPAIFRPQKEPGLDRILHYSSRNAVRGGSLEEDPRARVIILTTYNTDEGIASELGISERTVKTHLGHLFEKLGVTSRTEAVKVATRRGLVRLG